MESKMPIDEEWLKAQEIIACSIDDRDFDRMVIYHAKIMLYLICHKARQCELPEESIRWLYAEFAGMAINEFNSPENVPFWN